MTDKERNNLITLFKTKGKCTVEYCAECPIIRTCLKTGKDAQRGWVSIERAYEIRLKKVVSLLRKEYSKEELFEVLL